MKKRILCLALCAALLCGALSGCGGKSDTASKITRRGEAQAAAEDSFRPDSLPEAPEAQVKEAPDNSGEADDSSGPADSSPEEPVDVTQGGKYDPIVVNAAVDKAVAAGKSEAVNIGGSYSFTWSGFSSVYSNEELGKCFDRLQKIVKDSNFSMGFSFKNIDSGAYVGYNQWTRFQTCSTVKAPYVKSILEDGADLAKMISKTMVWSGDVASDPNDLVAHSDYGTQYTAKQLIEYAILRSDNTAYYLLWNTFGYSKFNSNQWKLGTNLALGYDWIFTFTTSDDMMKNYIDIYNYGEESDKGRWLIELLSDTNYNEQIGKALGAKYQVAQKYGSDQNERAFNDVAIVYADSPFVLSVFTVQDPNDPDSCQVFKDLAVVFDDINRLIAQ